MPSLVMINTQFLEKKNFKNLTNLYQNYWESRSTVRTRPRKVIDFAIQGDFFPEDKQPLLLVDKIKGKGEEIKNIILLQTFYKYLDDIVNLEIGIINPVCNKIIYKNLPVKYSDFIKLNLQTIMIDELYHVYIAKDMILQLEHKFPQLEKIDFSLSDSMYAVSTIREELDGGYHDIFEIIAVCIFETTLVRDLVEFFNSKEVHPSIKYYVNDHMNDEARHYAFFFDLLEYTWQELEVNYRREIGVRLAKFVKLYLNIHSEKKFNCKLLNILKFPSQEAERITDDLYKGFDISPELPIVKNVLRVLENTNILHDENVKYGFSKMGWQV